MQRFDKNPTKVDWARLAAFIDGEGAIFIRKRIDSRPGRTPQTYSKIVVTNCDIRLMQWLKETFGGYVANKRTKNTPGRWNDAFDWFVESREVTTIVLENCIPFFVIKREQAEIALAHTRLLVSFGNLREEGARKKYQESLETRLLLRATLSSLKTRGKRPQTVETVQ